AHCLQCRNRMKAGHAGVDNQKMWQWSDGAILWLRRARISSAVLTTNSARAALITFYSQTDYDYEHEHEHEFFIRASTSHFSPITSHFSSFPSPSNYARFLSPS